jgi:hypothetical protein
MMHHPSLSDADLTVEQRRRIDAALAALAPPRASDDLRSRLLADYDAQARARRPALLPRGGWRRFAPAGALAALSAAGFFIGAATASPQDDALAYAEAAMAAPFSASAAIWEEDQ